MITNNNNGSLSSFNLFMLGLLFEYNFSNQLNVLYNMVVGKKIPSIEQKINGSIDLI